MAGSRPKMGEKARRIIHEAARAANTDEVRALLREAGTAGRYKPTERYSFGWTDYRGVYGVRVKKAIDWVRVHTIAGQLIGTGLLLAPIGYASYWVWRWMGWM